MRLTWILPGWLVLIAAFSAWMFVPWIEITHWAAMQQRDIQNTMARALRAVQTGDAQALWVLCSATAAYGAVHAIGPGHGKILIGGAALASGATLRRLAILTVLSSLAQSVMAIFIVGALVFGARMSSGGAIDVTETWLAPLSTVLIAAIGLVLVWRGLRAFRAYAVERSTVSGGASVHKHTRDKVCGCGHAHGPSVEEVHSLESLKDAAAMVASIAIRPCTGALFVLAIAARFDAFAAGCLAVLTMGLGTAAFNLVVAAGGTIARRLTLAGQATGTESAIKLSAALHVFGGLAIFVFGAFMLLV